MGVRRQESSAVLLEETKDVRQDEGEGRRPSRSMVWDTTFKQSDHDKQDDDLAALRLLTWKQDIP